MDPIQPTDGNAVTQADVDFAGKLLNSGASPEEVESKLRERGLDPTRAAGLVYNLMLQALYNNAAALLEAGVAPPRVEQRLVEKGFQPPIVKEVIEDLLNRAQQQEPQDGRGSAPLQLLGGVIFVAGIGLLVGNVTGVFPTFPFAGFIVMTIGGAIFGAAKRSG